MGLTPRSHGAELYVGFGSYAYITTDRYWMGVLRSLMDELRSECDGVWRRSCFPDLRIHTKSKGLPSRSHNRLQVE